MRKYELSISTDYVPEWGVVEAVREFFQNAIDEETANEENKMFFDYDPSEQRLTIGNRYSTLDPKTLLLGCTSKHDDPNMIGSHGEGYKIATVVLLRLNKEVVFYNYGYRQVWRPRFVNSRKYGAKVLTFFVDTKYIWEKTPDNDLTVEILGITWDEYSKIVESNLHLQDDCVKDETSYGDLLRDDKYKGSIFVDGLYICKDPRIDVGVNFKPNVVRIERDRSMVDSFDVQWYVSKMIEQTNDVVFINSMLETYSGAYIGSGYTSYDLKDSIAKIFLEENGYDAVPIVDQKDFRFFNCGKPVIVSKSKKNMILESEYYRKNSTANKNKNQASICYRLKEFGKYLTEYISSDKLDEFASLINEVEILESNFKDDESEENIDD